MSIIRHISNLARKVVLRFVDPVVKRKVGKKYIYMRLSHMLPVFKGNHVLYDTAIARIVKYISGVKSGVVNVVDVGANVGDSASIILSEVEDTRIICVEGNDEYLPLLHKNFGACNSVIIEDVFCSDNSEEYDLGIVTKNGTASLLKSSENSKKLKFKTVDKIVCEHFTDKGIDLLKVDTDGFDYKVLRGAIKTINKYKPVVLFELDKHFLVMNSEKPMSVFDLFENCCYSSFIAYDNFGYVIGLFRISDKYSIEMLIDYFYSKRLYMDVLMIADELAANTIYENEKRVTFSVVGVN